MKNCTSRAGGKHVSIAFSGIVTPELLFRPANRGKTLRRTVTTCLPLPAGTCLPLAGQRQGQAGAGTILESSEAFSETVQLNESQRPHSQSKRYEDDEDAPGSCPGRLEQPTVTLAVRWLGLLRRGGGGAHQVRSEKTSPISLKATIWSFPQALAV